MRPQSHTSARRPRPGGRNEGGQALTEFLLCVTVMIPILLYSMYFFDLLHIRMKTQEAARYASWEFTAYPLSDYDNSNHSQFFSTAEQAIRQDVEDRFQNLRSTDKGPAGQALTVDYEINFVRSFNMPFPIASFGSIGGQAGSMVGGGSDIFNLLSTNLLNIVGRGLNTDGLVVSVVHTSIDKNKFTGGWDLWNLTQQGYASGDAPGQNFSYFADVGEGIMGPTGAFIGGLVQGLLGIGDVNFVEWNAVLADSWTLHDGSNVRLPGGRNKGGRDHPYYKQVQRVYLLGLTSLPAVGEVLSALSGAMNFLGNTIGNPLLPHVVSLSTFEDPNGNNSMRSGKINLRTEVAMEPGGGGHNPQIRFHTNPMRDSNAYDDSEYYNTFISRGDSFMGCNDSQSTGCED